MFESIKEYSKNNVITIGLILVLIVGTILRFKGLTFQSYWLDELWSAMRSDPSNSFSAVYNNSAHDAHPPFYQSLLWGWYHLFGFTEFTGRALSAFLGTVSIFTIYLLGKEFFNKEVGLYAAIIASMNYFLIYYSQEVRSYSLLFLLSTISYIYFIRVLSSYTKKNFAVYLLFTIILLYTHYFGFFLVATQVFVFLFYIIKEKIIRKRLLILAAITMVIFTIALLPLLEFILFNTEREGIWIATPSVWFSLEYMKLYVKNPYLLGIFLFMISLSLIYIFKKSSDTKYRTMTVVLLLWVILGYLLPYIRSITALPLLIPRTTTIVIPALILLISYGIYVLKYTGLKITVVGAIAFLSIYQLHILDYYNKVKKQQWREVLYELAESKEQIPIFDIVSGDKEGYYKTYLLLLNLNLDISSKTDLQASYDEGLLPKCFFLADGHGDHLSELKLLQDKAIIKVLQITRRRAKAVLYSYNIAPQICSERFSDTFEIDISQSTLSRPYKGYPLRMWRSGSVTTPVNSVAKASYQLLVSARGTKVSDVYAKLKIQVFKKEGRENTIIVEKVVDTQPDFSEFSLPFSLQQDNDIFFVVSFINDVKGPKSKGNRKVYLKSIRLKKE